MLAKLDPFPREKDEGKLALTDREGLSNQMLGKVVPHCIAVMTILTIRRVFAYPIITYVVELPEKTTY